MANNRLKADTVVTVSCCPTCGQALPDGPDAFVLNVKHGHSGYMRGCRCEKCVIDYRTYQRNYARDWYRRKQSKTGRFTPDGDINPDYTDPREPNGRFKKA